MKYAIIIAALLIASTAHGSWLVDEAFTSRGYAPGSTTSRFNTVDGTDSGYVIAGGIKILPDESFVDIHPGGVNVRVGSDPNVVYSTLPAINQPPTASAAVDRALNGATATLWYTLPTGYRALRQMEVSPTTGDVLMAINGVDGNGSLGDEGRLLKVDANGNVLFDVSTGSTTIGSVTFDDSGNAYLADFFGVMYAINGSGGLTATGEAISFTYDNQGGGYVDSMAWSDGAFFFGVTRNELHATDQDPHNHNRADVVRLMGGETGLVAYGLDERGSGIAISAGRLVFPFEFVSSGGNSLVSFLDAGGAPLDLVEGDLTGELLGINFASGGVPEPSTCALLLLGVPLLRMKRRRGG